MDALLLARLQFAITTVYHFFFVPLTLGLSILVALMETLYVTTGSDVYKQMTKFWGKLFVINFAMGVVTGIVQEFQFGMNWSEYSRFVGDIFGAPLAIEALLAFFLESTFLGLWIFGWDKLSRKMHAATIWLVAIGANISAFWILIANSFMQNPVGYAIENGRAVMTNFFALLLNPNLLVQFPHVILSGLVTTAFFILGISAYHLIKKSNPDLFKRSFKMGAIVGAAASVILIFSGHMQMQHVARVQPMKLAAAEGLWETKDPAPLSIIAIGNLDQNREVWSIQIPALLSFLTYNRGSGEVQGLDQLQAEFEQQFGQGDYIPNLNITYWSFRGMVGVGFLLVALAAYAVFLVMRNKLDKPPRWIRLFLWTIPLPYLANSLGWILTEVGRFPWLVYGLMVLEQGLSLVVPGWQVLTSLLGFTLIYGALMVADIYLLTKYARLAPPPIGDVTPDSAAVDRGDQLPSLLAAQD
jgi:cytochrome bd ubiquinol oxidase subunit I